MLKEKRTPITITEVIKTLYIKTTTQLFINQYWTANNRTPGQIRRCPEPGNV